MGKKSKRNVHAGTGDTAPEASSGGPPGGPGPSGPSPSGPAPAADGDVKKVKAKFKKLELEPSTSNKQTPGGKKTLQPASNPQATQQPLPVFAPPPQVQPQWPRAPPPAVTSAQSAPAPWGPRGQSPASQVAPQAQPTAQPAPAPWGRAQAPALQVAPQAPAQQVAPQAPAPAQVSPQSQTTAQSAPTAWGRAQAPAPAQVSPQPQTTAQLAPAAWGRAQAPAPAQVAPQVQPPTPQPIAQSAPAPWGRAQAPAPQVAPQAPTPAQVTPQDQPTAAQPVNPPQPAGGKGKKGKGKKGGGDAATGGQVLPLPVPSPSTCPSPGSPASSEPSSQASSPPPSQSSSRSSSQASTPSATQKQVQKSYGLKIPKRGKPEKKVGQPILIETNFLPLTISTKQNGVHYDVTIVPDKPKGMLVHVMNKFIENKFPGRNPAFDGQKNLYSCGDLPIPPSGICSDIILMEEEGRREPMRFEVTVKWAAFIDFGSLNTYMKEGGSQDAPQVAINCLDVVLRHAPLARFVKVGRSFFSQPKGTVVQLGGGLEMWYGVFQSAVLGWKPFINVDIAHKGFPCKQNLVDLIQELAPRNVDVRRGPNPLPYDVIDNLKKFIKSLKVEFEIPGNSASKRTYRVNDVKQPPGELRFAGEGGRMTTVTEYFRTERRYKIQYPHLPCVWVGKRDGEIKICYPVELCTVLPGQVIVRKMDGNQTTKMIQCSAAPADERKRKIMDAVNSMKYNLDPTLKEFGLKVSEVFEQVPARIIPAPSLQYQGKTITPRCGKWFAGRFITAAKLKNWTIVVLDRVDGRQIEFLITSLINMAYKVGMEIDRPNNIRNIRVQDLLGVFEEAAKLETQLVMVVVSEYGNQYAQVKQIAELRYGVLTQCVKSRTVFKMNDNTASQLLLKINAKLDQTNHALSVPGGPPCLQKPCMIVGADVTHPSPGQMDEPSLAAVVASHDPKAFKYNITLRLQPPKVEIISDLAAMMKQQLMFFFSKTKQKPQHIIFFRDGVSEGQFETVLNSELMAIRSACSQLNVDYKPKITFFVVQKRHHTRFFPTNKSDGDRNFNVPVGTCVDTQITHPTELDFYLLSHESIKGTARPTHYHRLWDDADMKESEVEELAFHLCHMFTRCNRSVSYPAPTYYAHLAALRAKVYIDGKHPNMERLPTEQTLLNVTDFIRKERPMYFV